METGEAAQATPQATGCCPPFDPSSWPDRQLTWQRKLFVKDHVRSILHVPLNVGSRVQHNQELIRAAGAEPAVPLMLSDETSLWGADIYIDVSKPVPGAEMAEISGQFCTKVYEGPFKDAGKWAEDMRQHVTQLGHQVEKIYFVYTTCPSCAKAYGKNYVILFAKVDSPPAN